MNNEKFRRQSTSRHRCDLNQVSHSLLPRMDDQTDPVADNKVLVLDLLSVHLVRNVAGNTIISLHPNIKLHVTLEAAYLHERIRFAGKSNIVYAIL